MYKIAESIVERSELKCVISNVREDLTYLKKYAKTDPILKQYAEQKLHDSYKNELLPVQNLAEKYNVLFGEKFFKLKLNIEKELNI